MSHYAKVSANASAKVSIKNHSAPSQRQSDLLLAIAQAEMNEVEIIAGLKRRRFPKVQQNYLDDVLKDKPMRWLFDGVNNAAKTVINYVLNPAEVVELYVGVRSFKRARQKEQEKARQGKAKRDLREPTTNEAKTFESWIRYLIGFGKQSLQDKQIQAIENPSDSYRFQKNYFIETLDARLKEVPYGERNRLMRSVGEDFVEPLHPTNSAKKELDQHCRSCYARDIVKALYS